MKKIEKIRFQRDPDIQGIEICRVVKSCHIFPNHSHDRVYCIGIMEEGGKYCLGRGHKDSFVAPGNIVLINPGQVHSGIPRKNHYASYRMIYVDTELMREAAGDVCGNENILPEFTKTVIRNPGLFGLLKHLSLVLCENKDVMEKESALIEVLSRIISAYGGVNRVSAKKETERRAVRQAREFLSENLDSRVSLQDVADAVGLSRYHFLRVFKKESGLSPHEFRTQQRIESAKHFLRRGLPFVRTALETGFSDQSHFSNRFRQYTGATPGQYLSGGLSDRRKH